MVRYYIVRHEGSWAYKMNETYSETFPSRDHAIVAALTAVDEASEQGTEACVLIQEEDGPWVEVPRDVLDAVRSGKSMDDIRRSGGLTDPDAAARAQRQS